MSITNSFVNLITALAEIESAATNLPSDLSECDKKVNDLYHIIELQPLDAVGLVKASVELRSCLQQRRQIKNQQRYIDTFKDQLPELDQIMKRVENVSELEKRAMTKWADEAKVAKDNLGI